MGTAGAVPEFRPGNPVSSGVSGFGGEPRTFGYHGTANPIVVSAFAPPPSGSETCFTNAYGGSRRGAQSRATWTPGVLCGRRPGVLPAAAEAARQSREEAAMIPMFELLIDPKRDELKDYDLHLRVDAPSL